MSDNRSTSPCANHKVHLEPHLLKAQPVVILTGNPQPEVSNRKCQTGSVKPEVFKPEVSLCADHVQPVPEQEVCVLRVEHHHAVHPGGVPRPHDVLAAC